MQKYLILILFSLFVFLVPRQAFAQVVRQPVQPIATVSSSLSATSSSEATTSATIQEKIQDKIEKDITQTTSQAKSKLAAYLDEHPVPPLSPLTFIQHAIRNAVNNGVPANILVLLLLFPVIASFIAIFRHIIGLRGFGVYTPAVLAVAFVSTGITTGLTLFILVFITATLSKGVIAKLKLQYLPRTAVLLWSVSLIIFAVLLFSPAVPLLTSIVSAGIFPMLVIILLSENFMEAQISGNFRKALQLTFETLVLAIFSAVVLRTLAVQQFVILHPEFTILGVLAIDMLIGRYTGLRITEFFRFGPIVDTEE